jgi:lysophospholipase L1-like esterase
MDRDSSARPSRRAPALALAGAAVLAGFAARDFHRGWNNSLLDNGRWISGKMQCERALVGAVAFFVTRRPLAGDRLDLGAWHGFQEVRYRDPVDVRSVEFELRLAGGAYATLCAGADDAPELEAVRLSRHPDHPSAWLTVARDGEFLARAPFPCALGSAPVRVALDYDTGTLALDGAVVAQRAPRAPGPVRIAFRGGSASAAIDDVVITARDGTRIAEDFASPFPGWNAFACGSAGALLAALGVAALRRRRTRRPLLTSAAAAGAAIALFAWVLAGVAALLARAHPFTVDYRAFTTGIETEAEVIAHARAEPPPPPGAVRIVCLGSSQTWGAGAARRDDVWPRRLERELRRGRAPDAPPLVCFAGGLNGAVAARVLEVYRREWSEPPADLVIVDLGHNDDDRARFRAALEELIAFDRARGTPTVLVLEPDSPEDVAPNTLANHGTAREVGARTGTPVVDMMARLSAEPDSGFLWWDGVHLTSFGQRRFAAILSEELRRLGLPSR